MSKPVLIKTGKKFGRLSVIKETTHRVFKDGSSKRMFICRCECGIEKTVQLGNLRNGTSKSCGCKSREDTIKRITKHGGRYTKSYTVWLQMKSRCLNTNNNSFMNYGGRGIKVYKRWHKFANFVADMGERPNGKFLDRINNEKGYYKENCRWATRVEQNSNKRNNVFINFCGKKMTLAAVGKITNIPAHTIRRRLNRGLSIEEAIEAV